MVYTKPSGVWFFFLVVVIIRISYSVMYGMIEAANMISMSSIVSGRLVRFLC
jgi:hypothetical protein